MSNNRENDSAVGIPKKLVRVFTFLVLAITFPAWAGSDFTVYMNPPNGTDDTADLQAALDDCASHHPTGCTIQLAGGTYKSKQLFIENFHGRVKGIGMEATVIEVLTPLEVTVSNEDAFKYPPSRDNKYPILLIFVGGDIAVSDMSFRVTDFNSATSWCYGDGNCGQTWIKGLVGAISVQGNSSANLLVERAGFEGGPGTLDGRNYDNGPCFFGSSAGAPPLAGTFKLVSSHINFAQNGLEVYGVREARVIIGGSPSDGNVIENCQLGGLIVDLDSSFFDYSYNDVSVAGLPVGGVVVWQAAFSIPQEPSHFLIQHNTFKATGGYEDGIWIFDFGRLNGWGKTADFVVSENTIHLSGSDAGPAYAGIESTFTEGTVISNNLITGANTLTGIASEGDSQCMLLGNNVQQVATDFVTIYLDSGTSNCTVVGGKNSASVYDEGTGNVITGVNNMRGNPPGPAIKQAMQRKLEGIRSLGRP